MLKGSPCWVRRLMETYYSWGDSAVNSFCNEYAAMPLSCNKRHFLSLNASLIKSRERMVMIHSNWRWCYTFFSLYNIINWLGIAWVFNPDSSEPLPVQTVCLLSFMQVIDRPCESLKCDNIDSGWPEKHITCNQSHQVMLHAWHITTTWILACPSSTLSPW